MNCDHNEISDSAGVYANILRFSEQKNTAWIFNVIFLLGELLGPCAQT